jgi:ATP-dependent DNA ligase
VEPVCEHELEGVVTKRLDESYRSGERGWLKIKNRAYWRYELERRGAIRSSRRKGGRLKLGPAEDRERGGSPTEPPLAVFVVIRLYGSASTSQS